MSGLSAGGRIPGRINVNTAGDSTIFQAIADPETGNYYTSFVNAAGNTYLSGLVIGGRAPIPSSVPYWPFGVGAATGGDPVSSMGRGITTSANANLMNTNTVFGGTPPTNPYQQYEIYNKLFNNTTTRSNVFAVWLTVGFFEVDAASGLLKGEINAAQGRAIRHRMFAIVDRTQLTSFPASAATLTVTSNPGPSSFTAKVTPTGTLKTITGRTVTLAAGMTVVVDPNTANEETVVLDSNLSANFFKPHGGISPTGVTNGGSISVTILGRGNPGPRTNYDVRQDPNVVPYSAIIK